MSTLGWFVVAVLFIIGGTLVAHLWVYAGVRAYYSAIIDAYKKGAAEMKNGGESGGSKKSTSVSDSDQSGTTRSGRKSRADTNRDVH